MEVLIAMGRGALVGLAAAAILAIAAPAAADEPLARGPWASAPIPWYAPPVLAYEEGMPIPPGYEVRLRPRRSLIIAGASLFGGSWLISALTAATVVAGTDSHRSQVAPLFAPLAGPWITLGTARDAQLNDRDRRMNGVLLLVDGAAQIGGAALLIAGLVTREPVLMRTKPARPETSATLVPEVLFAGRAAALRWQF